MPVFNRIAKSLFRLEQRKVRASSGSTPQNPRRRPAAHGTSHRPGDPVPESGIYEVVHGRDHRQAHEVVMLKDTGFPMCDSCADQVRFRLIRTAPYIFQDGDFEEQE